MNKTEALFIAAAAKREAVKAVDEKLPKFDAYIDARVKSVVSDIELQTLATISLQLRGTDGKDGKDGVDGRDGEDGERGPPGRDGVDGVDGADGADGADGKDGRDGVDGKDGRDGVDGKDGRDGADGKDGVGISDVRIDKNGDLIVTLTNGAEINAGRVKDGAKLIGGGRGKAGLSAYEIAVKNGFTGTEEEWLDSLQGSGGSVEPFKELRRFYVDPNGSDTEGNGAAENPYLTPQAAIDQMPSGSGFITILNEGVTGDFTLSRANTAVAGASSAYASSSRPNNVTISTPSGVSNRLADLTILGTLQRTGNAPLYLNNVTVNGLTTIGGTAFTEIKNSTLQGGGITQAGASGMLIRESLIGSSTFTTPGATILLRDVAISAGECVTIGAGVAYSLSGVQGCVIISPAAVPIDAALLASGFPAAAALAAETTAFNNLRITNPPLVSSPAKVLTYNQATGQVEHTDAANLSPADTFETVSKNLRSEDATLGYDGAGNLTTLTYADGIVKTLAYNAGGDLETITLSGATPDGISLVKTLTYTSGNLTGVAYT